MRLLLLPILCFLCPPFVSAQEFYDLNTIQNIEITFAESNWDALLDAQKQGAEEYILAQSVAINGEVFDSVGVKYKGNSTYNPNQTKNPWHIELDTYKDHDYQGYKDIKLSNVAKDPSFIREVLSYQILRQYMDAPLSNYANVYVNGNLIGLYSNSEAISKRFIDDRFGSKTNTFIKCNPVDGAGPQSTDKPNLVYMGTDSLGYMAAYELKSDGGWQDLIDLCDTLANHTDEIESVIDIDRVLWMHAFNNVFVNLDSYAGRFAQNYYLYKDDSDRFVPVVWDLNESFGRFTDSGSGNLSSTTAKQNMNVLLHSNDSDYPLLQKLLSDDTYRKMYYAHVKTMVLENFDNGAYQETGETLQEVIDAAVQTDGNKFFTYNNFLTNLTSDINGGGGGPGGGSTVGITNLMDGRSDYILGLSAFSSAEPNIENIAASDDSPVIGEELFVTAEISDADAAMIGYRNSKRSPFVRIAMLDDGQHGDGAAGDGVFGVSLPVNAEFTQYYIYAQNENIGKFSPQRAEFEYHTLTATNNSVIIGDLVINELMASNDDTYADADGEFDDWIELYNNGSEAIDLSGYQLSDDALTPDKWTFPDETLILAGEYLIIWADNDEEQAGLHATFKLSADGEAVVLSDDSGQVIDEVTFGEQDASASYGRYPNGTGDFRLMTPTPVAQNDSSTATENELENTQFTIFPNPTNGYITIRTDVKNVPMTVYNVIGGIIFSKYVSNEEVFNAQEWGSGVYFIELGEVVKKLVVE